MGVYKCQGDPIPEEVKGEAADRAGAAASEEAKQAMAEESKSASDGAKLNKIKGILFNRQSPKTSPRTKKNEEGKREDEEGKADANESIEKAQSDQAEGQAE